MRDVKTIIQYKADLKEFRLVAFSQMQQNTSSHSQRKPNYNNESIVSVFNQDKTISLNTLNGLFILTGENTNSLWFYSDLNSTIKKVNEYKDNHLKGSLIMDPK